MREALADPEGGAAIQPVAAAVGHEHVAELRLERVRAGVRRRVAGGRLDRRGRRAVHVVVEEASQVDALGDGEVDVGGEAGRQLAIEAGIEAVNPRVAIAAIEHAHAGEQRERAGRDRGRREQVRPHRHVVEPRAAEIALLLDPVGGDRSHLAQHVLPGVVDAGAAVHHRLPVLRHVPGEAAARLNLVPLAGDRAVRRKARIAQESRIRRRLRIDRVRHLLRIPTQAVIDGEPAADGPLVLHEQRELLVADVRCAGLVTGDAVGAAALQVKQQRAAVFRRPRRTACRRGDVGPV